MHNNFVERKRFYQNMRTGFDDEYAHILAGDFNCTQDNTIDRKPKSNQNDQVFQELDSILKQFSLEDIFHKRYPRKHAYTFTRGSSKFRIYYFCISTLLDCYMDDASIHYFPFSDHDAVVLDINLNKSLNGPGIWKINAQTIQTHVFRESLEKLWPTWTDKINEYENVLIWWEIAKIHIKQLTNEISKTLNTSKYEINKVEKRLNEIKDSDKFESECISLKKQ